MARIDLANVRDTQGEKLEVLGGRIVSSSTFARQRVRRRATIVRGIPNGNAYLR